MADWWPTKPLCTDCCRRHRPSLQGLFADLGSFGSARLGHSSCFKPSATTTPLGHACAVLASQVVLRASAPRVARRFADEPRAEPQPEPAAARFAVAQSPSVPHSSGTATSGAVSSGFAALLQRGPAA